MNEIGKVLRNNIKTLLESITTLHGVYLEPEYQSEGYPFAFVVGSGVESDYLTQQDNRRVYAYKVWLFQEFDQTPKAEAYNILYDNADYIMNKIDEQESPEISDSDRVIDNGISSPYMIDSVKAAMNRFALDEEIKLLGVELTVRCSIVVDIVNLT